MRFHFRRSGHCSTSELSDTPSGEDDQEHGERMSQGDAERTVFSSRASSVCGDIPAGPNVNDSNDNINPVDSGKLSECSNAPVNVSQIHKPISVNAKQTRPELTADNFDSIYASIFSVK